MYVEIAKRPRKCQKCEEKIPTGEHCIAIYLRDRRKSYCHKCITKSAIELIMLIKPEEKKNDKNLLKEHFVEVSL